MFFNKIKFLILSDASSNIIFSFIIQKFINFFIKKKIKLYKNNHRKSLLEKQITSDYFSSHAYHFAEVGSKLETKFNYLEIGSFEGNSAFFIAKNFPHTYIHCVDIWSEYPGEKNNLLEKRFDNNLFNLNNIIKFKDTSDNFFSENKKFFNLIYIDGYHKADQVYQDCKNAWAVLNEDGYLICDDYIGAHYHIINENPCFAINHFLSEIKGQFIVVKVTNSQIFLKKIKSK